MLFWVAYPVRFGPEVIIMQDSGVCIAPEVISMQAEACISTKKFLDKPGGLFLCERYKFGVRFVYFLDFLSIF